MSSGNISESPEHSIKLEYELGGEPLQVLWEPKGEGYTLQTTFDKYGGILDQKLINIKDYDEVVVLNDEHYNGSMKIRVIDTSKSALHSDFVKWLKANSKPAKESNK